MKTCGKIIFENGMSGMVDLVSLTKEGVFKELGDISYFKKFYVNNDLGTICWPNGQDVAPETLYSKLQH